MKALSTKRGRPNRRRHAITARVDACKGMECLQRVVVESGRLAGWRRGAEPEGTWHTDAEWKGSSSQWETAEIHHSTVDTMEGQGPTT
ncbi:UNVERIFIED_CONTAM: hypothetical protein FKN15_049210 [Acipenser sinensis]